MRITYHNIICCIMAFFMIVSSVCVDVDYVDSVFARSTYATSEYMEDTAVASVRDDYLTVGTDAQEIRAIQESSNVYATIRNGSRRNDTKWSINLIIASLCLQNLFHFQKTVEAFAFQETLYQTVIVSYIHEQDGMK